MNAPPAPQPLRLSDFLTIEQFAVAVPCSTRTVQRAFASGLIEPHYLGAQRVLLKVTDVPVLAANVRRHVRKQKASGL